MFWFVFITLILLFALFGGFLNLFETMRESEYDTVRVIYWILRIAFLVAIIAWILTWD